MNNDHSDGRGNFSAGTNHDDILNGSARSDYIDGRRGDDQIFGNGGNDLLKGGKGDDVLSGGAGNDILFGNSGKDILLGGAGNDILYGDDKSHGHFSFWWLCKPAGFDDYLDGGSGNDKVYGGGRNDFASYAMAENLGAHDIYDGGKGTDTLQLKLTYGEFALASVQKDIAHYQAFLTSHSNPLKDNGATFQFTSFDLDASDFEALKIELVNTGPTAKNDAGATSEDTVLTVPKAAGLLANDTDPDHLDVLHVSGYSHTSAMGAAVSVNADGSYSYDPTAAHDLQALAQGASATDTFTYTVADLAGATSTATVSIKVAGVNDAPFAHDDQAQTDEDTPLVVSAANGLLANDSDPDHADVLTVTGFDHTTLHGAAVVVNADGSFTYDPTGSAWLQSLSESDGVTDTFNYTIRDLAGATSTASATVKVSGLNDAPVAGDDHFTTSEDFNIGVNGPVSGLLANDSDVDFPTFLYISSVDYTGLIGVASVPTGPVGGSFGTFSFAPILAPEFQSLQEGESLDTSFTYTLADGHGGFDTATVTITVLGANDGPEAHNDTYTISEDQILQVDAASGLLANDTDIDGDTLSVLFADFNGIVGNPDVPPGDGSFSFNPLLDSRIQALQEGQSLDTSFTYYMTDGHYGPSKTATATITILGANDAPVGGSYNTSTNEDTPITFSALSNDTDVDGDTLAAVAGTFETALHAMVVLDANGRFTYNPTGSAELQALNTGETAVDGFDYTVSDGHGGTGTAHVGIVVNGITDAAASSNQILPSVSPDVDLHYFVRVENGDWLELDSFSLGLQNSGSISSSGGGAGSGRSSTDGVVLNLGSSAAILDFTHSLVRGDNQTTIEIEAYAVGGKGLQLVDEFKFNNALFTELDTAGTANQVSFDFGNFTHGHIEQDSKGGVGDISSTGWDFVKNTQISSAPAPHADAANADKLPQVAANANLDYYVHFDGADGWLKLDSFSMGLSVAVSIGSAGGGAGVGRASEDGVHLLLGSSAEILALTDAVDKGTHLTNVEIEAYAHGSKGAQLVDEFNFNNVLVRSLDTTNANANALTFDFGSFSHGHIEQDDKGGTNDSSTGWDFVKNMSVTAPQPVADEATPANSVSPDVDLHYFVRVENGDWLELDSFSLGLQNSGSISSSGGGAGSGRSSTDGVVLNLGSSAAILDFTHSLVRGDNQTTIEIEAYAVGGKGLQLVDEFKFNNALFTELDTAGTANQVSFDFGNFTHGHIEQDSKGGVGDISSTGWDFVKNTQISSAPAPHADAANADKLPQVAANANLDYYVHFDGADGWLKLDSFSMGLSVAVSIGSAGGGAGVGRASEDGVHLLLGSSAEILALTDAVDKGTHLTNVEIEAYAHGSKGAQLVDEFNFNNVLVRSLDTTNANANALTFDFGSFSHGHIEQDDKGGTNDSSTGWDFVKNMSVTAPQPVADEATPANSVSPDVDLHYFVRVENGDWLELDSFSLGLQNSGSISSSGGGAGSGRSSTDGVVLNLGSSAAILDFTHSLVRGDNQTTIEIEAYAVGGKGLQLVDEFKFNNALFTELDTAGTANQVSFDFGNFTHGHIEQDSKGGVGDISSTGWDFVKNTQISSAPAPHADAANADKLPQVAANANLDYYVHFDGADGWLKLDSFSMGLSVAVSIGSAGGGAGVGRASEDGVHLLLGSSAEILALTDAVDKGTHLTNVEIEAYAHGSKGAQLVDEFNFNNVLVRSLDTTNANANALTFDFGSFSHGHIEQDDKGALHSSVTGWDFVHNSPLGSATLPHADVDLLS